MLDDWTTEGYWNQLQSVITFAAEESGREATGPTQNSLKIMY